MIELVHNNEVVKVPEEMTVKLYQQFMKDQKKYLDNPTELISLFTDLPINKLKNLSPKTIDLINKFIQSKVTFPPFEELVTTFIHDGIEYGLETNFGAMAWGAWVDLEVYSSDNILDNVHKLLAILYRPIVSKKGKKYKIEPYDSETVLERAEIFLDIPVSIWFQSSDFFLTIVNLSISNIKNSLERKKRWNKKLMKGTKMLPKWLQKRLPQDFTFN